MAKSKVFLAWSGERSRSVAFALRKWLKNVIQDLEPWMSETDIEKGIRWRGELSAYLQDVKAGIVCLTPENCREPWIHFEAGALSKLPGSYVFTYLHELDPTDVTGPLADFNHTKAIKSDTWRLIQTLNTRLEEDVLEESRLEEAFNMWWEKLEAVLSNIQPPATKEPAGRNSEDMFREIVSTLRAHTQLNAKLLSAVELFLENQALSSAIINRVNDKGSKQVRSLTDMLQESGAFHQSDPLLKGLFSLGAIKTPDSKPSKDNVRSLKDDPE